MKMSNILLTQRSKYNMYVLNIGKQRVEPMISGKKIDGPTIVYKGLLFKIVGGSRASGWKLIKSFDLRVFEPQFGDNLKKLCEGLKDTWRGCKILFQLCTTVGFWQVRWREKLASIDASSLLLSIIGIMTTGYDLYSNFSVLKLVTLLVNIYQLFTGFIQPLFVPQSMDAFFLASLSMLLPPKLYEIVRRVSTFTYDRINDDFAIFSTFYRCIVSFLEELLKAANLQIPESLRPFLSWVGEWGAHHTIVAKVKQVLIRVEKDPRILSESLFRDEIKELKVLWDANVTVVEWTKKSVTIQRLEERFIRLCKNVKIQESTTRKEPCCFVFEGPPACMKSATMGLVAKSLKKSIYAHQIKSVCDGKDFYDSYNGEDIFMMDDLGQQGPSQYRSLINMVSTIRMPLDCAEARLKDTKFLTSELILFTSNSFMTLNNISKQDGIQSVDALWRRGFVFDFSKCTGINGKVVGRLSFKYYDLTRKHFVEGFPSDVNQYLEESMMILKPALHIDINKSRVYYVAWMKKIIETILIVRENQHTDFDLSKSEKELLESIDFDDEVYMNQLYSQMLPWYGEIEPVEAYDEEFNPIEDSDEALITEEQIQIRDWKTIASEILAYSWKNVQNFAEWCSINSTPITLGLSIFIALSDLFLRIVDLKVKKFTIESIIDSRPVEENVKHTSVDFIDKNVLYATFHGPRINTHATCMVSGHCILAPAHLVVEGVEYVTIYHKKSQKHVLIDHIKVETLFKSHSGDLVILRMPETLATPFKRLHKHIKVERSSLWRGTKMWFATMAGFFQLNKSIVANPSSSVIYTSPKWQNILVDHLTYDFGIAGLCGSPVISETEGILGFHVAGTGDNKLGSAVIWSDDLRSQIYDILLADDKFIMPFDISDKPMENVSGFKVTPAYPVHTSSNSNYVASEWDGVFENTRGPADLVGNGRHFIKDIAKKSFAVVKDIDFGEVKFAEKVLHSIISKDYIPLTESEIVGGTTLLCGLNKKSSNGYGCVKDKDYYIDFAQNKFTDVFRKELQELESAIVRGDVTPDNFVWAEALKDEIRDESKRLKPRSFRVSRLHIQVLTKKYFGNLVSNIMEDRKFNKIMIGVNPYSEWHTMYEDLSSSSRLWAGDIATFDGQMLPQLQDKCHDVSLSRLKTTNEGRTIASFLLRNLSNCLVSINDDTWMTTHSMPSGSFLTACFNSLTNKGYTAMWYYRELHKRDMVPLVDSFWKDVGDYVYGDDKVNIVYAELPFLNALTMRDYFESIGMGFTTSMKGQIVNEYESLDTITFLKRRFLFHFDIGRVMCPLDLNTLKSGLMWRDETKNEKVVMHDKLHCFQRELYLHEPQVYIDNMEVIEAFAKKNGKELVKLPIQYLKYVYSSKEINLEGYTWSGSKYV